MLFNFWPFRKKPPIFIIDEYPLIGSFYARRKGHGYLKRSYYSGLISTDRDIYFATKCRNINEAEMLINQYKEQYFLTTYKAHIR